ncbi:MAG TPA: hypothetical protein VHF92_15650 [Geodermatophilus sp.]|nr:hypothetical protein [Geodermatophilus sp.]
MSIGVLQGGTRDAVEFAFVFIGVGLAVGFCRSITTEPIAEDLPALPQERVRAHVRASGTVGLAVGLVAALLCALLVRPDTAVGLWSLALPLLLVPVDAVRAAWTGARRAHRAAPLSLAQLAAGSTGLAAALLTGRAEWALAPVVVVSGVLVALALVAAGPRVPGTSLRPRHWIYAVEWSLTYGLAQSSGLVLAGFGLPLLPLLLRAQGVVFGPLSPLAQAVAALAVPEFAAVRRRRPALLSAAVGLSVLLVALSAAYAVVVLLLPDAVTAAVLGSAWQHYAPVLVASAAAVVAAGAPMGPLVAMRAHGAPRTSLVCRIVLGSAGLLLPVPAALLWGASGFFWATAAASLLGAGWSVRALRLLERRPVERRGAPVLQRGRAS